MAGGIISNEDGVIQRMKADPNLKLVRPSNGEVRKMYWASDYEQWEVYSGSRLNRGITFHYKGTDLQKALLALDGNYP